MFSDRITYINGDLYNQVGAIKVGLDVDMKHQPLGEEALLTLV